MGPAEIVAFALIVAISVGVKVAIVKLMVDSRRDD